MTSRPTSVALTTAVSAPTMNSTRPATIVVASMGGTGVIATATTTAAASQPTSRSGMRIASRSLGSPFETIAAIAKASVAVNSPPAATVPRPPMNRSEIAIVPSASAPARSIRPRSRVTTSDATSGAGTSATAKAPAPAAGR